MFGVILRAPLHSPGTEHFPSPSLISSWRKYLPQVNTTLRPLGHPLSLSLSCLCPGACLGLNPRINQSTNPKTHLPASSLHTAPVCGLVFLADLLRCCSSCTGEDTFISPPPSPHPSVSNLILSTYHQV